MTAKEYAQKLVDKHLDIDCVSLCNGCSIGIDEAKQCALITINEMLDFRNKFYINNPSYQYLLDVKTEIEKL